MKNNVKFGTIFNVQNEFIEEFLRLKKNFFILIYNDEIKTIIQVSSNSSE